MPRYCENSGVNVNQCICKQHISNRNLVLKGLREEYEQRSKAYLERPGDRGRWYNLQEAIKNLAEAENTEEQ
jgi:hypothetical protein